MSDGADSPLLAIDVGSSRIKLAVFTPSGPCASPVASGQLPIISAGLAAPVESYSVSHRDRAPEAWTGEIASWVKDRLELFDGRCAVAAVHPGVADRLHKSLADRFGIASRRLTLDDAALEVRVAQPEKVGVDRLMNAVAVNQIRRPNRPAIVVGFGTAVTVDLIAADGALEGGAILPGPAMAMTALHQQTASLPQLASDVIDQAPPSLGKSTQQAMAAGVYWGIAGGVGRLVDQLAAQVGPAPLLIATGGAASLFAGDVQYEDQRAEVIPHLTLAGVATTFWELSQE